MGFIFGTNATATVLLLTFSVMNDECVEEEDMSLDSDDGEPPSTSDPVEKVEEASLLPPPPETNEFRPPLPDQQSTPERTPSLAECTALKTAISQFRATNQIGLASSELGSLSPGGFPVNTHQSFLCPSSSWSSYTGSSSYVASPAYPASPCSGTQEQETRPSPATASTAAATPPVMPPAGPLANLSSLPLEVKPPPPPHLMMQGQTYGSDAGGAGAAGTSPLVPTLPYKDLSDAVQPGYMGGIATNAGGTPTQQERTLSKSGEVVWSMTGTSTCETASSQGGVTSMPMDPSSLPKTGDVLVGSTAVSQGGRTQMNCSGIGASVGIPPVATRGGSIPRPKLPPPPPPPVAGVSYGTVGSHPGHLEHGPMRGAFVPGFLGNYRGRGVPPVGFMPRPGRGQDLGNGTGSGPCSWGYPTGRGGPQNYYTDYTYSHNYTPE